MRNECIITRATNEHVLSFAGHIRPEHAREITCLNGMLPDDALLFSVEASKVTLAALVDGQVLCLFGAAKPSLLISDTATVWMLGREEMDRYGVAVARAFRRVMPYAHDLAGARVLEQWIPDWYATGQRWVEWLGFTRGETRAAGIGSLPHTRFYHEITEEPVWGRL